MAIHNDTCGCADCGNYGQGYNPRAIHNQSCGCERCGNYGQASHVQRVAVQPTPIVAVPPSQEPEGAVAQSAANQSASEVEMVAVPLELLDEVRALIARRGNANPPYLDSSVQ